MLLQGLTTYIVSNPRLRNGLQRAYCAVSKHVALLPPLGVVIELTYACNWRCAMCFHHRPEVHERMARTVAAGRNEELSTDEMKALISDVAGMGVRHISFHGGEPLIRRDFCDLVDFAHSLGLHSSAFSNATLITDEIAARLAGKLAEIGISIHGGETTHDAVTGIKGSFEKCIAGTERIEKAKQARGTQFPAVHLTCIVSGLNYLHLDEMTGVCKRLGISQFGVGLPTFTSSEAVESSCSRLPGCATPSRFLGDSLLDKAILNVEPARYIEATTRLKSEAAAAGIRVGVFPFASEQEVMTYFMDPFALPGKGCDYPWFSSVVSAYGDVYPCIQMSFLGCRMGNVRETPFEQVWKNRTYRELRRSFLRAGRLVPICAKCCAMTGGE